MSKILLILSLVLMAYGIVMYVVDFLPVDMFQSSNENEYIKSVSGDSISWSAYRLHALVVGLLLVVVSKFTTD
ncbi:hypothetical protein RI845_02090 [Thalassotalea nanhaiensis]|uniref:DUF4149 domain-containing protein n=1 Tax=Thalassotalea nanhaiensis TaxID=3065648 RepID=A0ABY9TJF0_9GAMM|nr:hypothetical protein RI845_02090 [Colwelliaceae bacterium SQ345]